MNADEALLMDSRVDRRVRILSVRPMMAFSAGTYDPSVDRTQTQLRYGSRRTLEAGALTNMSEVGNQCDSLEMNTLARVVCSGYNHD